MWILKGEPAAAPVAIQRGPTVTVVAARAAVRAALAKANLEPQEQLSTQLVAGSASRMAAASVRVADDTRAVQLEHKLRDGILEAGALAVVMRSDPTRARGTTVRLRPSIRKDADGGYRCDLLGGPAGAWPLRLQQMLEEKDLTVHGAVGIVCVNSTPWLEVAARSGRWNALLQWATERRVNVEYEAPPKMWGVLIPAVEHDVARQADRIYTVKKLIGIEDGWAEAETVQWKGKPHVRLNLEAPDGWRPVEVAWILEDEEERAEVRMTAPQESAGVDADEVECEVGTPPPRATSPPQTMQAPAIRARVAGTRAPAAAAATVGTDSTAIATPAHAAAAAVAAGSATGQGKNRHRARKRMRAETHAPATRGDPTSASPSLSPGSDGDDDGVVAVDGPAVVGSRGAADGGVAVDTPPSASASSLAPPSASPSSYDGASSSSSPDPPDRRTAGQAAVAAPDAGGQPVDGGPAPTPPTARGLDDGPPRASPNSPPSPSLPPPVPDPEWPALGDACAVAVAPGQRRLTPFLRLRSGATDTVATGSSSQSAAGASSATPQPPGTLTPRPLSSAATPFLPGAETARPAPNPPRGGRGFYAVCGGRGGSRIYHSWDAARLHVEGVSGVMHKRTNTRHAAEAQLREWGVQGPILSED